MKTRLSVAVVLASAMILGAAMAVSATDPVMGTGSDNVSSLGATQLLSIPSGAIAVSAVRDHDTSFFASYEATGVSGPSAAMAVVPYYQRIQEKR